MKFDKHKAPLEHVFNIKDFMIVSLCIFSISTLYKYRLWAEKSRWRRENKWIENFFFDFHN